MNRSEFEKAISGLPLAKSAFFENIGSTNDVVAEWARRGEEGLCLAAAYEQTQGRGRGGRRWFTPPGSALAFSLLLESAQAFDPVQLGRVSGLGALAVCQGIEKLYQLQPKIKWPNDVLLNGKKVCGVLPETYWVGDKLQALILGIGINVASSSVPPPEALNFPATSLEDIMGHKANAGELLRAVLEALVDLKGELGQDDLLEALEVRLAYKMQTVTALTGNGQQITGQILGLASDGSLKMKLETGKTITFQAGEIQLPSQVDTQTK